MNRVALQTNGNLIRCGGIRLRTPGMAGMATQRVGSGSGLRSQSLVSPDLSAAMQEHRIIVQETLELENAREVSGFAGQLPRTRHNEPAIELQVPAPSPGWGQFVLTADEAGVLTWEFTDLPRPDSDRTVRGQEALCTYHIRRAVPPPPARDAETTRGWIGYLGKKVIQVLVFPLIDPILGDVGGSAAGIWEQRSRPYRLRSFAPENYKSPDVDPLAPSDWERLSSGRSLLFIHGTFSRAHTAFGDLPVECLAELHRRYDGRVFAFDHFTLTHDPRQNVEWFRRQLPAAARIHADVVCHSRGGLVARTLAEKGSEYFVGPGSVEVDRVIHVGAPNLGTPLTDTPHLDDLIESYTNILNLLPDSPSSLVLDGLFLLAKQVAAKTVDGLDGLFAMLPGGPFLKQWLNVGVAEGRYFAIASNYRPTQPGLLSWMSDRILRDVFQEAENDLVVPTASVYDQNGSSLFPIAPANRLVFQPDDGVTHTSYFRHPRTHDAILHWLE